MGIRITGISSPIFGLTWEFTDKNGKNSEHYIVPDKRIKVFFSSNYSEAKYDGIRKKLKDRIEETQLASVYISEGKEIDDAFCLEESDVCFYIIDNSEEIKETVLNEIEIARKRELRAIYYFCDQNRKEATPLELSLIGDKKAKCKTIHSIDELTEDGASVIINDIISVYHYFCTGRIGYNQKTDRESIQEIDVSDNGKYQVPTIPKSVVKNVDKCRKYIHKIISGYERKYYPQEKENTSFIDDWCFQFLPVLFERKSIRQFNTAMYLETLKKEQRDDYYTIVELRWRSIQFYFSDEVEKCLDCLNQALQKAKDTKQPSWIINDILIDVRNVHYTFCNIKNSFYEPDAQKELRNSGEEVYYPIIDRINESMHEKYIEELYSKRIQSPYTISLGNNLDQYGEMIASIYVVAMYNGSLTQLLLLYDKLKNLFFFLGNKYEEWHYRRDMYKFAIYSGEDKEIKGIQESYPEIHNKLTSEEAAEIIDFCNNNPIKYKRLNSQLKAFSAVGYYLDDQKYEYYEEYIVQQIKEWLDDEKRIVSIGSNVFKCLSGVAHRLSQDTLAEICCLFIERHYSRWYLDMFKLIGNHIDLNKLSVDAAKRLINRINEILDNSKEREQINYYPQFLCDLRKQNVELTEEMDKKVEEYFPKYYGDIYKLETMDNDEADLIEYIMKYIESIKYRNETQGKGGRYSGYATEPIASLRWIMLSEDVRIHSDMMDEIISTVADTILISKEGISTKLNAITLLCCIPIRFNEDYVRNRSIFERIYQNRNEIESSDISILSSNISNIALKIGLQFLFASMGIDVFNEILELMPYLQNDAATIISVEHAIAAYMEISDSVRLPEKIEAIMLQNVLIWLRSESLNVRWYATRILMYLLRNKENQKVVNYRLINLIDSDGVHIKNLIMRSINDLEGVFDQTKDYILDKCKNDANYVVRMVYEQEMGKMKESIA